MFAPFSTGHCLSNDDSLEDEMSPSQIIGELPHGNGFGACGYD